MKKFNVFLIGILLSFALFSCNKETKSYPVKIRMTDGTGPYDRVFIDLQGIELKGTDGVVVTMDVHPGVYNLLDFSNGNDTLIATGTLADAGLEQIRLILGTNNTVMVNGITFPLSTPGADQSGLKLQVHQTLAAGVAYTVLLDFDANKSIIETGNGTYKLKPVIRTIETAISGSIKGKITPVGTMAVVTATSVLSYSSDVTSGGDFIISGLPPGTYSLTVTPVMPLHEITVTGITVITGIPTDAGTVHLQ